MKLYEVPSNTMVRLVPEQHVMVPPDGNPPQDVVLFHHVDGAYSYCTAGDGTIIHLAASTEVEIV